MSDTVQEQINLAIQLILKVIKNQKRIIVFDMANLENLSRLSTYDIFASTVQFFCREQLMDDEERRQGCYWYLCKLCMTQQADFDELDVITRILNVNRSLLENPDNQTGPILLFIEEMENIFSNNNIDYANYIAPREAPARRFFPKSSTV